MKIHKKTNKFLESHFIELKARLLNSLLACFICSIICWFFRTDILTILRSPIQVFLTHTNGSLIFTAPLDAFLAYLQISIFAGIFISSPYWSWHIWQFILPGLHRKEKKIFILFYLVSASLFLLGTTFVYFIILPLVFQILIPPDSINNQAFITIKSYLSFFIRFAFIFGMVFEMPLILIALCQINILSTKLLKKYRKHAIVGLAFLSALITPPDLMSQMIVLFPLIGLYELSIYLTYIFRKKIN